MFHNSMKMMSFVHSVKLSRLKHEYDISYVNMVLLFDFKDCEFDVDKYIGAEWNILSHTMNRIMNIVKTKI